ncbi:Innexin [Aphelenchoides bicaudatus]|nr:Innexin [Aphelenchoides bicaudatus]
MKIDLLLRDLKNIKLSRLDDTVDRLCYLWTSLALVFFAFVVEIQSTFKEPLQCMFPKNFDDTWKSYSNNYCYIEGTFHTTTGTDLDADYNKYNEVQHYQWIPCTLALQALSFVAPHFFYLVLVAFSYSGFNFKQVVDRYANVSALGYLLEKVLNVVIVLANIYFVNIFVGKGNFGWVLTAINQALEGHYLDNVIAIFPRATYCKVKLSALGQLQVYTVQCLLMFNILIEKVYVLVYFWLLFLLVVTVGNLIWVVYKSFIKHESRI